MSQKNRLDAGGRIDRAAPLTFTFNGRAYQGFQGDTLASALLANGVHFVARSFKYHRPRGIVAADVTEPNALVQLERGAHTIPNARATEVELYEGLVATSVNAEPDIEHDRRAIHQKFSRFLPAGFYYKTFMWPRKWWPKYEEKIRAAAGFGKAPEARDNERYDKCFVHCDVLVVGGGPTGLAAAWAAGTTGARVILVDDQREPGGSLLACGAQFGAQFGARFGAQADAQSGARRDAQFGTQFGTQFDAQSGTQPAMQWVEKIAAGLARLPDVKILARSTAFGYHDHNFVTVVQRLTDHLPVSQRASTRELLWKIRARRVVLATGAHERPLVFGNNDLPGVMLASAVSAYIHRYGVLPGRKAVVFTNNDDGYQCALDLKACGAHVTVVDPRAAGPGALPAAARRAGVTVLNQTVVMAARGALRVASVETAAYVGEANDAQGANRAGGADGTRGAGSASDTGSASAHDGATHGANEAGGTNGAHSTDSTGSASAHDGATHGANEARGTNGTRSMGNASGTDSVNAHDANGARGADGIGGALAAPGQTGASGASGEKRRATLACDLLAMSGGFNPVLHLFAQSGGRARWCDERACFVPGQVTQAVVSVGAAAGEFDLARALPLAFDAGRAQARAAGFAIDSGEAVPTWIDATRSDSATLIVPGTAPDAASSAGPGITPGPAPGIAPKIDSIAKDPLLPLWLVGSHANAARGPKQFVDFQNDVAASDILLAAREGFESIEHVKRYTAMGFGTDQGKLGNINGMAILAQALGKTIPETGTTTFRPNYTPVSFGAFAGRELGDFLDPVRKTCLHEWHAERGALFEDVGNWKRPWYYPRPGEDLHAAVARECVAVRTGVGILDASTLGKIDIQGPDAAKLLNWAYTNPWNKLEVGKCRYGLMLDENGMVFDDGVTVRLADQHYLMTTTTGNAARVLTWLERWLQTEWPNLKVRLTSVTDHWATFAVVGPHSRAVLRRVCADIDFASAAFAFMTYRVGTVAGVAARVMRISFSGELAYEVNVPANAGRAVWEALIDAGADFGITPYGTETMHVLRAEKGYIIVGQDTDGSVTPHDLGMGGLVAQSKDFLGKRSLARADTAKEGRKQFVGLLADDARFVIPEGSQIIASAASGGTAGNTVGDAVGNVTPMLGHVTSSYYSPTLKRSIALALVKGGLGKMGQSVTIALAGNQRISATIASAVFYDNEGARQHVE